MGANLSGLFRASVIILLGLAAGFQSRSGRAHVLTKENAQLWVLADRSAEFDEVVLCPPEAAERNSTVIIQDVTDIA